MKRLYEVTYPGSWLGGIAIVFANSVDDAISQVQPVSNCSNFEKFVAKLLPESGIVYIDNGEY